MSRDHVIQASQRHQNSVYFGEEMAPLLQLSALNMNAELQRERGELKNCAWVFAQ